MERGANRKARGRGRGRKPEQFNKANDRMRKAQQQPDDEDPRTFWERSNARLGVAPPEPSGGGQRRSGRAPVEYPCSVCGTMVTLDRWPRHRHDVICPSCRKEMSGLMADEDVPVPQRSGGGRRKKPALEGLPEMTPEDLEALAEMRAAGDLGNGRSDNKRRSRRGGNRGGGGGQGRNRRRSGRSSGGGGGGGGGESRSGGGQGGGNKQSKGEGQGQGRRRRRRRKSGGGNRAEDQGNAASSQAQ